MKSKFSVVGQFDRTGQAQRGTVTIDRATGTFTARPYRSRRDYSVSLSIVAVIIAQRIIIAEQRAASLRRREASR